MVLPIHLQLALNKLEKGELRFFVVSKFRVFLLAGKSVGSLKVERSFNVLALKSLQVVSIAQQESGVRVASLMASLSRTLLFHLVKHRLGGQTAAYVLGAHQERVRRRT